MSFNIRYGTADDGDNNWQYRKELVFDVLRTRRPDILGLQEALRFQMDEILSAPEMPAYEEIGVAREDGKKKGEYSPILYFKDRFTSKASGTFWFSETPNIPSISWDAKHKRICTWARLQENETRRTFYVYNLHLDNESVLSRKNSVQLLIRRIANRRYPDPVMVTGDFNAGETDPIIKYLTGDARLDGEDNSILLTDTHRVLHPEETDAGTVHGWSGRRDTEKIDYIFMSASDLDEVLKANIIYTQKRGRFPSDHYPIQARLRF
ncbi:hypothetical protein GWN42_00090 [candidate division KSB1 bacterium]|nr:hypothetical protein [candidate division KSB1 bacterium]